MLDKSVFSAKFLPRIKSPAKNKTHVITVISRSTVKNGKVAFRIMAILETPPVTMFMGMINTAVPKARSRVPRIIKDIFLNKVKDLFCTSFNAYHLFG